MSADQFPSHWQLLPLSEAVDALIDYRGKTPRKTNHGVPLVTAKIVKGGTILPATEYIAEEDYDSWMVRGLPKAGDVVVTTEAPLGEVAQLADENVALAQRIVTLRGAEGLLQNDYLRYVMQGAYIQGQLESRATGSTVKGIKQSELRKIILPIPPEHEQIKIAGHLRALDDRIQINHQINQTLEQMAQAIFKSWFVDFEPVKAKIAALEAGGSEEDALLAAMQAISGTSLFDADASAAGAQAALTRLQAEQPEQYAELRATAELFPSAMQDSELGEIPEGWGVVAVSDFGRVVCGKTPSKKNPEFYGESIPFIKIPDMHGQLFATRTTECLSTEGAASQRKKEIPKGAVCVSCIATVGQVIITTEESHTNQQINSIVPFKQSYTTYLYFRMGSLYKHLHDLASGGSATLNLNTGNFSKIEVLKPSVDVLERYHSYTSPMLEGILNNAYQIHALENLRDTLLPKLLYGDLSISQVIEESEDE
ncbi:MULTISPECIES: restriction endonuclease subunit S [unclassified Halomonas]|uniref:restriction endonuclease subunit S n=1 Tax=unclassified Halomonas TaxID=2609666 RepID=UPI003FB78F3D